MSAALAPAADETLEDLLRQIGSVPLSRIPKVPAPGTATEQDVVAALEAVDKRLYELVDGVLVEKPMGYYESWLAMILAKSLGNYLDEHNLGIALGEAGALQLTPGLVRIPDVSFISWERLGGRRLPRKKVPALAPDLAVEILSESNTRAEISRKLDDYFGAGTRLVWVVDPVPRSAAVHKSPTEFVIVTVDGTLDAEDVLPGFRVSMRDWFERAGEFESTDGDSE